MALGSSGMELRSLVPSSTALVHAKGDEDNEGRRRRLGKNDNDDDDDDTPFCCYPLKVLLVVGALALLWTMIQNGNIVEDGE